ncbi:MAG TPA: response regulator [Mucilaginibacter sp.]|nr:response regulator [Mucilaginibacter sp.]
MRRKILIIEDDADTAEMLEYLVGLLKYEAAVANYIVPVNEILTINPDLILLDHKLNNGSGGVLCQKIKNDQYTKEIPVIMVSARHDLRGVAKNCGADDHIAKPFSIWEMEKRIENLLENKKLAKRPA